jgi:hypothetical protein
MDAQDDGGEIFRRLAKVIGKPGIPRSVVFGSNASKKKNTYAYYVYAKDPTKFVREDRSGKKVIGNLVNGKFRPIGILKSTPRSSRKRVST